jgi:predicted DNA-binding protein with PD1-like motif
VVTLQHRGPVEIVVVGLEPGEMLLESIREAIREHDIQNGAVVSGIGTLKTCQMHYVQHTGFPPRDERYTLEKPLELVSVSGAIADGEPHLHIVVSCRDEEVYAGHLEDESEVLYLAEIVVLKFNDLEMARRFDAERGISLLGPKGVG